MDFLRNPAFILRALIALAYVAMGFVLLANAKALTFLSPLMKYAFALLLIAYGIFRGYRAWNMFKNDEL